MKRIVAMLLLAVFLTGCTGAAAAPNGDFEFYYRSAKDETAVLVPESVTLDAGTLSLYELMTDYLRGPTDKQLRSVVPAEWTLESAYLDADTAVLIFSDPYYTRPAIEVSLARAAIARTLLQLDAVQKVSITLSGKEDSVTLTQKDILFADTSMEPQQEEMTLYFADGRYLRRETVTTEAMDASEKPRFVLEQLFSQENSTFPQATALLGVTVENGICTVDVSSAFATGLEHDFQAARLGVYAIVNTLTELPEIRSVDLWVAGAPMETLGLMELSKELRRDESLIAPQDPSGFLDVTIYPAAELDGLLVPIARMLVFEDEMPVAQRVLEALLGFEESNGIRSYVPAGTKILSVKLENGACTVDLTREFLDGCRNPAQERLAVRSIIATLSALREVDTVELLVEGIEPVFRNVDLKSTHVPAASWFAE